MDDERTAEGVEHLQRAAKELVAAARSFLDVVEDVVEDPDRFAATATSMVELVRGGFDALGAARPDAPWAANAWTDPSAGAHPDQGETAAPGDQDEGGAAPDATDDTPVPAAEGEAGVAPRRAPKRVRRIAVD